MTVSAELDRRFRDAAAAEGLLDVAYELHDTPVGRLLIAVTEHGVCEIHYDADPDAEAERLARLFGSRVLRSPRPTDEARRQLDEYFAGGRREFDLEVDLRPAREFGRAGAGGACPRALRRADHLRNARISRGKARARRGPSAP
jgi:methylated-DNA-[protein]-cysteine S-methyltransferase